MSRPSLFIDASLEQARAQAQASNKLLLVDFTATWCAPCRHMDNTTWQAPEVIDWVKQHAIAVQVDIDEDPAAKSFGIQAVPTIMLFRGSDELDRISGARPAPALLSWFDSATRGETELDRLRAAPRTDPHERLQLAQALVERNLDDEATEEFAWLWEHILEVDRAFIGVKHSFLIAALEPLIERSAKAKNRFEELRTAAEKALPNVDSFRDWVTLSSLLKDEQRVFDFVSRLTPEEAAPLQLHRERHVLALLEAHEAWALLGRLVAKPIELLKQQHEIAQQVLKEKPDFIPEEAFAETREIFANQLRNLAANLCRGMKAAGRVEDAHAVASEARRLDGSKEMAEALSPWCD